MRRAGPEQSPRFFGPSPGLGGGAVRAWPLVSGTLPLHVQNGKLWVQLLQTLSRMMFEFIVQQLTIAPSAPFERSAAVRELGSDVGTRRGCAANSRRDARRPPSRYVARRRGC